MTQKYEFHELYDQVSDAMRRARLEQLAKEDLAMPTSFPPDPPIRTFESGATRDTDSGKLDFEGFLAPAVLREFAQYMHKNRIQSDGTLRASDNCQKGIPKDAYMKSMWRHFMDVWSLHRGAESGDMVEALCALLFNVQGYIYELVREGS